VLAGEMATAYFKTHFPQGFWPLLNGGELAALYCFVFLFIAAAGPGPVSLDALMRPRSTSDQPAAPRPRHGIAAREASARG
jgi:putative oxidoreductase